jgi:hypothetical protein
MTAQKEKTTALVVATLASFLTPFLGAAMNVALPVIGKDLEADAILLNRAVGRTICRRIAHTIPGMAQYLLDTGTHRDPCDHYGALEAQGRMAGDQESAV